MIDNLHVFLPSLWSLITSCDPLLPNEKLTSDFRVAVIEDRRLEDFDAENWSLLDHYY